MTSLTFADIRTENYDYNSLDKNGKFKVFMYDLWQTVKPILQLILKVTWFIVKWSLYLVILFCAFMYFAVLFLGFECMFSSIIYDRKRARRRNSGSYIAFDTILTDVVKFFCKW